MDLVVFDIDGTLQDTGAWWPALCNDARREFASQRGVQVEPMSGDACNALIGRGEDLWDDLLPGELRGETKRFADFVIEREVHLLRSGRVALFDGTLATLDALRDGGFDIALASNCGRRYLEAFLHGPFASVRDRLRTAACLDGYWHPRTRDAEFFVERSSDKILAVARLLARLGPAFAVLVGDRRSDAAAALGNRIPFVLRTGWHAPGELGEAASFDASAELPPLVAAIRAKWQNTSESESSGNSA
ncbi:MAG: HAD family hydrolase [Planctomycetes bacterium]|nr:HAD family hydrolase [Planctomycetota bacterium]MCB9917843.1 HAD family hydrolase [Planctomycetota bacterium]